MSTKTLIPPRAPRLSFMVVAALIAWSAQGALGRLLQGMQPDDRPAAGIGVFRGLGWGGPAEHAVEVSEAIRTWFAFRDDLVPGFLSANGVIRVHSVVGIVFTLIAVRLVVAGFTALRDRHSDDGREWAVLACRWGVLSAVVVGVVETGRRLATWVITDQVWNRLETPAPEAAPGLQSLFELIRLAVRAELIKRQPDLLGDAAGWSLWLLAGAAAVALAVMVVAGVVAVTALGTRRRLAGQWPYVRSLRAHIVLVALLVPLMALPQVADVIRGWDSIRAAIALFLLVVFAALIRLSGQLLVESAHQSRRDLSPRVSAAAVGVAVLVIAALQLAAAVATEGRAGRGLLIPAVFVLGLWLAGGLAHWRTPLDWIGTHWRTPLDGNGEWWRQLRSRASPAPATPARDAEAAPAPRRPGPVPPLWALMPSALAAAAFVIVGLAIVESAVAPMVYAQRWSWVLLVPLVPVAAYAVAWSARAAIGMATVVPVAGLALLAARWSHDLSSATLVVIGVLTVATAVPALFDPVWPEPLEELLQGKEIRPFLLALAMMLAIWSAGAAVSYVRDPVTWAPRVGAAGIIMTLFGVLAVAAFVLVWISESVRAPVFFHRLGFDRTPVFVLFLLWFLIASAIGQRGFHDVRVMRGEGRRTAVSLGDAFEVWRQRNPGPPPGEADAGEGRARRPAVPLILVSTSGGGIRAAVWTSYVLSCVFEGIDPPAVDEFNQTAPCAPFGDLVDDGRWRSDRLFVASGVSGGALGLVSFAARLRQREAGAAGSPDWVREVLGDDYLAAPLSRALLVDNTQLLFGFDDQVADSAELLERAWEASWEDDGAGSGLEQGLFESYAQSAHLPVIVANGTSVNDGCRLNASVLEANTEGVVRAPGDQAEPGSLYRLDAVACTSPVFFESSPASESGTFSDHETLRQRAIAAASLPAAWDVADFLCLAEGEDLRLSTTALLSARFPLISPSGRLDRYRPKHADVCDLGGDAAVHVVDGGYVDGSGARTLRDLWGDIEPMVARNNAQVADELSEPDFEPDGDELTPCIVPFMLHIDNGYDPPPIIERAGRPWEFLVPLITLATSRDGHVANARAAAALEFEERVPAGRRILDAVVAQGDQSIPVSRYARLTTRAHPGVQAPLGWTLSDESIDDLGRELASNENADQLRDIRQWFDGSLACLVRGSDDADVAVPDE